MNIEEITKNFLYYMALGCGTVSLIGLLIAGAIRIFCIMLDHLKVGKVLKELLPMYIKEKRKPKQAKSNAVVFNASENNQ